VIIVSALDNSGQMHAAELVRALREFYPDERFVGIGGRELADAGCELIHDISDSSAMLTGVFGALKWAIPAQRALVRHMATGQVKLVILVDSPTFNLPLAAKAKRHGIKTFYYIAPQVWAWATFRVRRIRRRVDRLAVILPFEEPFFRKHGIDAHFVGHPFIHRVHHTPIDDSLASQLATTPGPRLVLLPGSRRHLVHSLLPQQLAIVRDVADRIANLSPIIVAWPTLVDDIAAIVRAAGYTPIIDALPTGPNDIAIFSTQKATVIASADAVLSASGTGTLEIGWRRRPMVIVYDTAAWLYHLVGQWLIHVRHLSLINILAGRELVPEFMPHIRYAPTVANRLCRLLTDRKHADANADAVHRTLAPLASAENPARRAACLAAELIERR
jgi:lipid-A-disaccharide synthase